MRMEKLKFALFSIVTLSLLGLLGYWSVVTLQSGTEHMALQKMKALQKENEDLKAEVEKNQDQLSAEAIKSQEPPAIVAQANATPAPIIYKYQDSIDALQKLIDNNVFLKLKSAGGSVGTVQKFLNIYNNTLSKVNNYYGAGTVKAMTAFQKDMGLSADGEAGKDTFNAMIGWLQNQK